MTTAYNSGLLRQSAMPRAKQQLVYISMCSGKILSLTENNPFAGFTTASSRGTLCAMQSPTMPTDISKYRQNLFDIKKRVEVISEHLQGIRNTKYLVTEVEFLCLQFRKVLELIALSSLIANKDEYSKVHEKFAKHYNARLIFQDLERINPEFYPKPSRQKLQMVDGKKVYDLEIITEGYLTKEDFLAVYEKCGGLLHAENPYGHKRDLNAIKLEFPVWKDKIVVLLNHHTITLIDDETLIIGMMEAQDGFPYVFEFKKLDDADADVIKKGMK